MTKTHLLIATLVFVHLLGNFFWGYWAVNDPIWQSSVFVGLIFSQTSLLGMWSGFGNSPIVTRLIILCIGTTCIGLAFALGLGEIRGEPFFVAAVSALVVALVCWITRMLKAQLGHDLHDQSVGNEGLQFTIKHLFMLTFSVAVLVTIGKLAAPYFRGVDHVSNLTIMGDSFAAVALTSIWAILGLGCPIVRSIFVIIVAVFTGWSLAFVSAGQYHFFWILSSVMQALFLTASLVVFRAIGFRIVAKRVELD